MSTMSARAIALFSGAPGPSLDLNFLAGGPLDSRITFTRAAGPATYFNAAGVLTTAGTDVARFDYDPVTLAPRGLLMEETRTNLLLNSTTLGTQSVTVAAVAHTLSFTGTGTITLTGVSTAGPLVGTGINNRVALTFTPTAGSLTCTVTGTVSNANLEAGAFGTSYITTAGATATRAADVATQPVGPWFNAAQGTLIVTAMSNHAAEPAGHFSEPVQIDNGSDSARYALSQWASTSSLFYFSAPSSAQGAIGSFAANTQYRAALAYNGRVLTLAMNGGAVVTADTTALVGSLTTLRIGSSFAGVQLNGWISRVRYWPRPLSDSQLQSATR